MTAVIGLDCSLSCTGIAVVSDMRPPELDQVKTSSSTPLPKRLDTLYARITSVLKRVPCRYAFLERPFEGGKGPSSWKNGLPLAIALLACEHRNVPCMLIAPMQRAKYATGKGNAPKDEVFAAAIRRLDYRGSSNDEADALWLAFLGLEYLHATGQGFDPQGGWHVLPQAHYDAVDSLVKANEPCE